jgi:hypothetical protein
MLTNYALREISHKMDMSQVHMILQGPDSGSESDGQFDAIQFLKCIMFYLTPSI